MRIDITQENGNTIVTPFGRIDNTTSEEFSNRVFEVAQKNKNIVIDMKELIYISSSGLRVLLTLSKLLKDDGRLVITHANETIMQVFELTGFDQILTIEEVQKISGTDIKACFFDIDGTLLTPDKKVPQSTIDALKQLKEKGVKVVICTGRDLTELKKLPIFDIDFDGFLTLNGNICYDENETIFDGNEIDPDEVDILVNIFAAGKIPFILVSEKRRYINFIDDLVVQVQNETNGTLPEIGEYSGEKIYQCIGFVKKDIRHKLKELLDSCEITSWNENAIDIIAKTGGKDVGIEKYLEYKGYSRSQSMSFGDGENDIPMIEYCGIGVAMENGTEHLIEAADYVTDSVTDDGIKNALIHFGMIEDKE
ncbi:MAG: Cof-type HAD-IIB family hydrolase [Erysipelotrichaceae bacterium]|nr:Cof-type HAD-IIB family hydrolase [Erysipelotrichaceae bacterium]